MSNNAILTTLERFCSLPSVSGNESAVVPFLQKILRRIADTITVDRMGNIICQKGRESDPLVIFSHIDKIGFVVSKVSSEIEVVGLYPEVEEKMLMSQPVPVVVVDRDTGQTSPATLVKHPGGTIEMQGASGNIGDFVSYVPNFRIEENKDIVSQGLDNASGVATAIELFNHLKSAILVLSVQEEMGFHGARFAAKIFNPSRALVIDVTYADDSRSPIELGKGVSFCVKDNFFADPLMLARALNICQANDIDYQLEVLVEGKSDMCGIYEGCDGARCLFVGIPLVGMHTNLERVRLSDLYVAVEFCRKFADVFNSSKLFSRKEVKA